MATPAPAQPVEQAGEAVREAASDAARAASSGLQPVLDFELVLACPEGFDPDAAILQRAQNEGAKVRVVRSAAEAAEGAIAVNTDVWASMGQEEEFEARKAVFEPYQVDARLMAAAAKDAIFLHCLPAHRGEEVTEEVLEGPASLVWLQAKNRLYVQEAIMDLLISGK